MARYEKDLWSGLRGNFEEAAFAKCIAFYLLAGRRQIKRIELNRADQGCGVWIEQTGAGGVMGRFKSGDGSSFSGP